MSLRTRGVVACASVLLAVGCGQAPVTVTLPPVPAEDAVACRTFLGDLPQQVAGQDRRDVSPEDALGAAWGDPPIALVCGVSMPPDYTPGATCSRANGVDWFIPDAQIVDEDETTDITMTAVGHSPLVQVRVPGDYRPEGLAAAMTEIGAVVDADLAPTQPCSTGK